MKVPTKQEIYDEIMSDDSPRENKPDWVFSRINNLIKAGEDGEYDSLQDEYLEALTWKTRAKIELDLL